MDIIKICGGVFDLRDGELYFYIGSRMSFNKTVKLLF